MLSFPELAEAMDKWADQDSDDFKRKLADYIPQGSYERMMLRMTDSPTIAGAPDPHVMLGAFMAGFELGWEVAEAVFKR